MKQGSERSARRLLGVLAVAAVLVVAGCAGGGGGGGPPAGGSDGGAAGPGPDAGSGGAGGGSGTGGVSEGVPSFGSYYDDAGNRVVVRSAEMTVRVDDFEAAFRQVRKVVRESGGYVGDREQTGRGEWDRGYFVVKVPATEFSRVRDAVAKLGRVREESVEIADFTGTYRNRTDRLAELRADERRLERRLENESGDVEDVRAELREVRRRREEVAAATERLRRRAALSTIRVELVEPDHRKPHGNDVKAAGLADTFLGAFLGGMGVVRAIVAMVGWTIPVVAAVAIVGLVGAGSVPVVRQTWRLLRRLARGRVRESADESPDGGRDARDGG